MTSSNYMIKFPKSLHEIDMIRCLKSVYESDVELNPYNYHAWRKYLHFQQREGSCYSTIQQTFERAIQNIPKKKCFWSRDYVNLWLDYAQFEEREAKDVERARRVYFRCIRLISQDKVWISAAKFEINQSNFEHARILFEFALKKAPTKNIFRAYIEMERKLGDIRRCQTLFMRYVQWSPDDDHTSWVEYVKFERSQSNPERARLIYDIAIQQPTLYKSTSLWISYIDFEISEDKYEKARQLFELLLERNKHFSIWIEYAMFEASKAEELLQQGEEFEAKLYIERVRDICKKALDYFTSSSRPANSEVPARIKILKEWEGLERNFGSLGNVNLVFNREE